MSAQSLLRGSAAVSVFAMIGACATGQVVDAVGDGGGCIDDPSLCAADASAKHDGGKDGATSHDSSTADAPGADASGNDATGIDSAPDAGIDVSIDTAPDTAPDTGPDAGGVLVFDSIPTSSGSSSRTSGDSCGTAINVTTTQSITQIAVKNTLTVPTNIKFMIWNKTTSTLLYISPPKNFTTAGDTWKTSDPLTFTLQAGTQYYVGGIADTGGTWDYDTVAETQNGITSLVMNPNWSNYTSPMLSSSGGADCGIRLYR